MTPGGPGRAVSYPIATRRARQGPLRISRRDPSDAAKEGCRANGPRPTRVTGLARAAPKGPTRIAHSRPWPRGGDRSLLAHILWASTDHRSPVTLSRGRQGRRRGGRASRGETNWVRKRLTKFYDGVAFSCALPVASSPACQLHEPPLPAADEHDWAPEKGPRVKRNLAGKLRWGANDVSGMATSQAAGGDKRWMEIERSWWVMARSAAASPAPAPEVSEALSSQFFWSMIRCARCSWPD